MHYSHVFTASKFLTKVKWKQKRKGHTAMLQARLRLARTHSIIKVIGTFLVQFVLITWLCFVSTPILGVVSLVFLFPSLLPSLSALCSFVPLTDSKTTAIRAWTGGRSCRGKKFISQRKNCDIPGENVRVMVSCVSWCDGADDVNCSDVTWYDVLCVDVRWCEDGQCSWLRDVMSCDDALSCDVMWCGVRSCVTSCHVDAMQCDVIW